MTLVCWETDGRVYSQNMRSEPAVSLVKSKRVYCNLVIMCYSTSMAKPWDTLKHYQKAVPFTKLFAASQKIGSYCSVQSWETRLRFVSLRNAVQRLSWAVSDPSKSHCDFRVQVLLGTSTSKNNSFQRLGHYCHNTQDYIKTVDLQTLLAKSSNIQHLTLIAHDLCLWPWIKDDEMMEATSALQKWDPLSFPRINCWTHHHLLRSVLGRIGSLESWGFWSHKQQISESSTGYMAGPCATTTGPWWFFQGSIERLNLEFCDWTPWRDHQTMRFRGLFLRFTTAWATAADTWSLDEKHPLHLSQEFQWNDELHPAHLRVSGSIFFSVHDWILLHADRWTLLLDFLRNSLVGRWLLQVLDAEILWQELCGCFLFPNNDNQVV